jgi:hypothetical protein
MTATDLRDIAAAVVKRAEAQGAVTADDIQDELTRAGAPPELWKDVLALARPSLSYKQGRYHFVAAASPRLREEKDLRSRAAEAVRELVRQHRAAADRVERREEERLEFVHPVKVQTSDQRELTFLTRDLSANGIRLIGTRSLLGQKVRVWIPRPAGAGSWCFRVQVVWTSGLGEDLFENGGTFLDSEAAP